MTLKGSFPLLTVQTCVDLYKDHVSDMHWDLWDYLSEIDKSLCGDSEFDDDEIEMIKSLVD